MSASISKLVAAPLSLSHELTAALGVINFDFSLVKVEAPMEYKAIGARLSKSHKGAAEDGKIHETARKLRSLFAPIIPDVPHLYEAYGRRASEIMCSLSFDAEVRNNAGPFAAHIGIDGSSLWAAATSGKSAIAVHLLACMLARIWDSGQATSLWDEIVRRRKNDLAVAEGDDPADFHQLMASKISISRRQLREWDASARAWFLAADEINSSKSKRQRLFIDSVQGVPVNLKPTVYESVMQAWFTALKVVDLLIHGLPQSIQDGAALLGLSAWHIYPDMIILGETTKEVKMQDPLVAKTGILTLGLSHAGSKHDAHGRIEGIFWSLPLSRLRYYGRPVLSESALNEENSRLSMRELGQACLGILFRNWGLQHSDVTDYLTCFVAFWKCITGSGKELRDIGYGVIANHLPSSLSWLCLLAEEAQALLSCTDDERQDVHKMFNFGRRRNLRLLEVARDAPEPMYGLCNPANLLAMLRTDDFRLNLLQRYASSLGDDSNITIIRYRSQHKHLAPMAKHFCYKLAKPIDQVCHAFTDISLNDGYISPSDGDIVGPVEGGTKFFWCQAPLVTPEKYVTITVDDYFGPFSEFALFRGNVDRNKPRVLTGIPFDLLFGDPNTAAVYRLTALHEKSDPIPMKGFSMRDVSCCE